MGEVLLLVLPQRAGMGRCDCGTAQANAVSALQSGWHAESPWLSARLRRRRLPTQDHSRSAGFLQQPPSASPGCGRTFSVWLADKIRRLSVTTRGLWRFLQRSVAGNIAAAGRAVADCRRSGRTWQRLWRAASSWARAKSARRSRRVVRRPINPRHPKSWPISKLPFLMPTARLPTSNIPCGLSLV